MAQVGRYKKVPVFYRLRYRQPTALVKRTARAVPFKKEQKKVPQTLM